MGDVVRFRLGVPLAAVVLLVGSWVPANADTTAGVPEAPTSVTAQAGDQQATVNWSPPQGVVSPITGYQVRFEGAPPGELGYATWSPPITVSASTSSLNVTGLKNGLGYMFGVTASNANGTSVETYSAVVVPSGLPAAPTGVSAVPRNRYALVGWTAADPNGSAISHYTVTAMPGGAHVTTAGSATAATIPGLINGVRYSITVTATNANGTSEASAPTAVTPRVTTRIAISGTHPYFMGARRYYPIRVYVKTDGSLPGNITGAPPGYVTLAVSGAPGVAKTYRVPANNTTGVVLGIALTGRQGILSIKAAYPGTRAYSPAPAYTFDPMILRS